jgi:transcriptional regulator with XRE-family HTH domain
MDLVTKLRDARWRSGLTQKEVASASGIGVRTISSFETGERIESLKVGQLRRILRACGTSEAVFFGLPSEEERAREEEFEMLTGMMRALPDDLRQELRRRFEEMAETALEIYAMPEAARRPATLSDWQMLTSQN